MSEPGAVQFTDEELSAARRELVRMPDDLRRRVHAIAERGGVATVSVMAFLIRQMRNDTSGRP